MATTISLSPTMLEGNPNQAATMSGAMNIGPVSKLDTQLASLYYGHSGRASASSAIVAGVEQFAGAISSDGRSVVIDATAADGNGAALLTDLEQIGLVGGASFNAMASGWLPISQLGALASLSDLHFARESAMISNVGTVTTQADAALRASTARTSFGVNGTGVKVGVLSDSFNTSASADKMANDIATGDLPVNTTILQDSANGTDEGRGMAQLVHDVAPGASIAFATANGGQANFANNIIALRNAGSKVIVDDVIYFAEPMFQDGVVAQAVNQAVAGGSIYFSSAGNNSHKGYEAAFIPTSGPTQTLFGKTETWHAYETNNIFMPFTLASGRSATVVVQWNQPAASVSPGHGATGDLDLFLTNNAAAAVIASFSNTNNIGKDPIEVAQVTNVTGTTKTYNIVVGLAAGSVAPSDMKIVVFNGNGTLGNGFASNTNNGTVYGHAVATSAIAVGAASYAQTPAFGVNPPVVESFSSAGPTRIYYDTAGNLAPATRQTPQITAPDGGNTTFFGSDDSDADLFPNFYGTSAAAPDAAAVAALMLQRNPGLTAADVKSILMASSIDMSSPGFDVNTGSGLIQADRALNLVPPPLAAPGTDWMARSARDFNANGTADILFQNSQTGAIAVWLMNNTTLVSGGSPPNNPGTAYQVRGAADFNADGRADILYQNVNSTIAVWLMNGTTLLSGGAVPNVPGTAYHVIGAGDFNGDGRADILFQNDDSTIAVWLMNGTTLLSGGAVPNVPGTDWRVVGPGDFDGNGRSDILFQNVNDGRIAVWLMNGTTLLSGGSPPNNPGADWRAVGAADFNADGRADVLFQNVNDGRIAVWLMNGTTLLSGGSPPNNPGADWRAVGTADFNGDGRADVLFQNVNSTLAVWDMNGTILLAGGGVTSTAAAMLASVAGHGAGTNTDTVFATTDDRFAEHAQNLVLQAGAGDLQGYGNDLANTITGNEGSNLIDGGAGADLMIGGAGNDTYVVDNAGDVVVEGASDGIDAVLSTASHTLEAHVENLVLQAGAGDLQGTGNDLANTIAGNDGDNLIDGAAGADVMIGNAGNDTYVIDDVGDVVVENAGEGTDAVFATVSYILSADVEDLVLQGAGNLAGTGNDVANAIVGNSGDNALDGQGGADLLTGNAGDDTFMFRVGQADGDTIVDFAGNGAAAGDSLRFVGYGDGATFTQTDPTHWQINYAGGTQHEVITFMNGAAIDASDIVFV